MSLLHQASESGDLAAVKDAIASGANLDIEDESGDTALSLAAGNGRLDVVDELLRAGADPMAGTYTTAMIEAAQYGHLDVVQRLFAAEPALVEFPDEIGTTSLVAAAANGHAEVCRFLIETGMCSGKSHRDAALLAAERGHQGVLNAMEPHLSADVRERLQAIASLNASGDASNRPHSVLLYDAVDMEDEGRVRQLIENGANVNEPYKGVLPLARAAARGWMPGMKILVDAGANPNLQNAHGEAPIASALANRHFEAFRYLWSLATPATRQQYLDNLRRLQAHDPAWREIPLH